MDKQRELQQWIEIANSDLATAQYLAICGLYLMKLYASIVNKRRKNILNGCLSCENDMERALEYAQSIMEFVRDQFPGQFSANDKNISGKTEER